MADKARKKELKKYIEEQLDSGHTVGSVLNHLVKHGHKREEIEDIFEEILDEEESQRHKLVHIAAESLFIIIFAIFIFWVGVSSESPFETVFVGFLPTIVFIIFVLVVTEKRFRKDLIPAMPLLLALVFYIGTTLTDIELFQKMETGKIAFLNLILSYAFIAMIYYSDIFSKLKIPWLESGEMREMQDLEEERLEKEDVQELKKVLDQGIAVRREQEEKHPVYVEVKTKEEEPIEKLVQSLESNLKALNAVIGRVYRRANGGTDLIRDLIKIKPEWYNSFNTLLGAEEGGKIDKGGILKSADAIERRLDMMFKKERELFGMVKFKNLQRDPDGNSKIIDVLMLNDNDPVETYFENALITCGKIKERLGKI